MKTLIEELYSQAEMADKAAVRDAFFALRAALSKGEVRAAEPDPSSPVGWRVNTWVKQGILLAFRYGTIADLSKDSGAFSFVDKHTMPPRRFEPGAGVRIVPGGSSVRDGAYMGRGVICMPPMYINIGAYVGDGTLVDSHALVGSCAQIGKHVHISAAAQIGGVIEPVIMTSPARSFSPLAASTLATWATSSISLPVSASGSVEPLAPRTAAFSVSVMKVPVKMKLLVYGSCERFLYSAATASLCGMCL